MVIYNTGPLSNGEENESRKIVLGQLCHFSSSYSDHGSDSNDRENMGSLTAKGRAMTFTCMEVASL